MKVDLRTALHGIKEAQAEPQQTDIEDVLTTEKEYLGSPPAARVRKMPAAKPKAEKLTSTRGKSSNPDYEAVKLLVRSDLRRRATRKWEDTGRSRDFSDLLEHLLTNYLNP